MDHKRLDHLHGQHKTLTEAKQVVREGAQTLKGPSTLPEPPFGSSNN